MTVAAERRLAQPRDERGRFIARPRLQTLKRYLHDPVYRAALDAERDAMQARIHAAFDTAIAAARQARGWET